MWFGAEFGNKLLKARKYKLDSAGAVSTIPIIARIVAPISRMTICTVFGRLRALPCMAVNKATSIEDFRF